MKRFFTLLFMLSTLLVFSQAKTAAGKKVLLKCDVRNCTSDSMLLFEFNGMSYTLLESQRGKDRMVTFQVDQSEPRFYYVGFTISDLKAVIMGSEPEVNLNVNCASVKSSAAPGSPINRGYDDLKKKIAQINADENTAYQYISNTQQTEENKAEFSRMLKQLDRRKLALRDSVARFSPYLAQIVSLNMYMSYEHNKGKYTNEVDYFANEYFKNVKLDDPALQGCPWVTEVFKGYTGALVGLNKGDTYVTNAIRKQLKRIPEKSNTYKLALAGVVTAIPINADALYMEFGDEFATKYAKTNKQDVDLMTQRLDAIKRLMIGIPAPDFTLKTPDGKDISLSSFKGKYLLVDFWASWCGPCRRENPNVVALYNRYKDKGFDIFGVSLDQNKELWMKAIENDKLTWKHGSDLKGWQSAPAAQYGITGIPHTILIDKTGKIIARQLRGEALAAKLDEIFKDNP